MLLDLNDGITTQLPYGSQPKYSEQTRRVLDWLQTGSEDEDKPICRASNHFHNPTKPFPQAGVTDLMAIGLWCAATSEFTRGNANATWATGFTAPDTPGSGATGNFYDWKAARDAYLQALTLDAPDAREGALAKTFVTLGYLMHLLQDLAVPAHARDDFQSHIDPNVPFGSAFEHYVETHGGLIDGAGIIRPPFENTYVTRFWDTGRYRQTGLPEWGTARGLAEYTSANFLSLNTSFTEDKSPNEPYAFPWPKKSNTNLNDLLAKRTEGIFSCPTQDGRTDRGRYLTQIWNGEYIAPFVKVGYLFNDLSSTNSLPPDTGLVFQLDDCVHEQYAQRLLPRAIGYSTALLDYFFRGKLNFTVKPHKNAQGGQRFDHARCYDHE
jgi:hypothetical protein